MAEIHELEVHRTGGDNLLAFKKDVDLASSEPSKYSEVIILRKVVKILRRQMFDYKSTFDGKFHEAVLKIQFLKHFFSLCAGLHLVLILSLR